MFPPLASLEVTRDQLPNRDARLPEGIPQGAFHSCSQYFQGSSCVRSKASVSSAQFMYTLRPAPARLWLQIHVAFPTLRETQILAFQNVRCDRHKVAAAPGAPACHFRLPRKRRNGEWAENGASQFGL